HLAFDRRDQIRTAVGRSIDLELVARNIERREKRQALDVVPVKVGQKQVGSQRRLLHQTMAERADSGSGVEDKMMVAGQNDINTGGIAAIKPLRFLRSRYRA